MTKSLTEADKVARLRDYYGPQADRILEEVRKQEEGRFGRVLAERSAVSPISNPGRWTWYRTMVTVSLASSVLAQRKQIVTIKRPTSLIKIRDYHL